MWFRKGKYEEFVSSKEEKKSYKDDDPVSFTDFLDGSILESSLLRKQMPMIIMLFIVCMIVITIRNHTEKAYRYKNKLEIEVKELKYESISISSGLMNISKQSEIIKRIEKEGLNLIESAEPPVKIEVEEAYECQ
jgi:hypothetical protein